MSERDEPTSPDGPPSIWKAFDGAKPDEPVRTDDRPPGPPSAPAYGSGPPGYGQEGGPGGYRSAQYPPASPGQSPFGQSPYGQNPGQNPYGQNPYGQVPYGDPYGQNPYGQNPYGYGYGYAAPRQDKGATTSLVIGIVGFFICGVIFGPAAIVEGVKSRKRIRESGGMLTGDGMALAGVIIGSIVTAMNVLLIVALIISANTSSTSF